MNRYHAIFGRVCSVLQEDVDWVVDYDKEMQVFGKKDK